MTTQPISSASAARSTDSGKTQKRARTKHACDECRRSQKKCDGERPLCRRCYLNGTQCTYTPHKSRSQCSSCVGQGDETHNAIPVADVFIFSESNSSSFLTWSANSSPEHSPIVSVSGPGTPLTMNHEIQSRASFQNLRTNELPVHSNVSGRLSHRTHPVYSHRSNSLPDFTSAGSSSSSPIMEEYPSVAYPSSFPQRQTNGSSSAPPTSSMYPSTSTYESSSLTPFDTSDPNYFSQQTTEINPHSSQPDHYRRSNMTQMYFDKRSQYNHNSPQPIREDLRHYTQDFVRHNSGSYTATFGSLSSPLSQTTASTGASPFQASNRDASFSAQPPVDNPQSNFHQLRSQQSAHEFSSSDYYMQSSELDTAPTTYQSTGIVAMSTNLSSPLFAQHQLTQQQFPTSTTHSVNSSIYSNPNDYSMGYY